MKTTIVWGPPACGKSSYIDSNAGKNSLVWDFDRVMRALSNNPLYVRNENLISLVADLRTWITERSSETGVDEFWVSATWVNDEFRKAFEYLDPEYHLIQISKEECIRRLEQDVDRVLVADEQKTVVQSWYDTYKRGADMKDVERRFVDAKELRASDTESTMVHGYPIVYDVETDIGPFRERVAVGAARSAIQSDDIFLLLNHDQNFPLARTANGTMIPGEDEHGVYMDADLSKSHDGPGQLTNVRNKLITGMSFAFEVDEEEWEHKTGEKDLRTISKFKRIYDFSLVTFPAYKQTEVQARSAETIYRNHQTATAEPGTSTDAEVVVEPTLDAMKLRLSLIERGVAL